MQYHPFSGPGRFYRGNLHTHSTRSDGCWSPEQTLARYRQAGYDFIALTDHNVFNRDSYGMPGDFIVLPGAECHIFYTGAAHKVHHFVALGRDDSGMAQDERIENEVFTTPADTQAFIDGISARGNYMILCHPGWSRTTFEDYGPLRNLLGVEVFNTGCHMEDDTGYAHMRWDDMLRSDNRLFAFATDDCHRPENFFGGWVGVFAPELSRPALLDSLAAGRFYASNGPQIHDFYVEDGEAVVRCSPCGRVFFLHDRIAGARVASLKGPVTEARFKLPEGIAYIRVQCVADDYTMAWSQPIWLD